MMRPFWYGFRIGHMLGCELRAYGAHMPRWGADGPWIVIGRYCVAVDVRRVCVTVQDVYTDAWLLR